METVLSVELLCAAQAVSFLHDRGLRSTAPLEALHDLVRSKVPPYDRDRYMAPDINAASELIRSGQVWETVRQFLNERGDEFVGGFDD